jgi:hypothetical protein
VAAELVDGTGDGVWLVELAALRIAGSPGRPVLETLLDALAPQDILIVLDNCEHLISACANAADAITRRCPRVHLLVTSREPLGIGGETVYRVPPLSLPGPDDDDWAGSCDAVALFVDRRGRRVLAFPLTGGRSRLSCRSAGGWTGCRWPSSSPPPGCAPGPLRGRIDILRSRSAATGQAVPVGRARAGLTGAG